MPLSLFTNPIFGTTQAFSAHTRLFTGGLTGRYTLHQQIFDAMVTVRREAYWSAATSFFETD